MSATPETDAIADFYLAKALSKDPADRTVPCQFAARLERDLNRAIRERDEARESLRILAGLVAYGLGQSGEEWSLEAMRQATTAIQNAKSLEAAK